MLSYFIRNKMSKVFCFSLFILKIKPFFCFMFPHFHLHSVEFPTNSLEMNAVAGIFDMNNDGFIDYYEFVSALHPSRDPYRKTLDSDQINEEVRSVLKQENWHWKRIILSQLLFVRCLQVSRQVSQCNCPKRFEVEQISANRYRVRLFFFFIYRIIQLKPYLL